MATARMFRQPPVSKIPIPKNPAEWNRLMMQVIERAEQIKSRHLPGLRAALSIGERREAPADPWDRQSGLHRPGVPVPEVNPADAALASFQTGDPAIAYEATRKLAEAYRSLLLETAKLRFLHNLGTSVCNQCDGLHAGPGVTATCWQLRQCHYGNLREDETTPRQQRALKLFDK